MSDISKDVATYLQGKGVGTISTDLYYSKMPSPSPSVSFATVLASGGFDPLINSDSEHYQPTCQIMVTGAEGEYDSSYAFAETIRDAIAKPFTFVSGVYTYYGAYQQGDINAIGYDANDRPEFSLNFRFYRRKANT
jgi:hypothetical protein